MFPRTLNEAEEMDEDFPRSEWGREKLTADFYVRVSDPEIRSSGLQRYTTYVVSGRTYTGSEFSVRKRYNDFEWVQKTLRLCFPGIFIPPIPRKQRSGRFEEEFIQRRKERLQEFLERIFNRSYLASSRVFVAWLISNDSGMEQLKRTYEKPAQILLLEEFKSKMDCYIDPNVDTNSSRTSYFRSFLTVHQTTLESLSRLSVLLGGTNGTRLQLLNELHDKVIMLNENESHFLNETEEFEQPCRLNLADGLRDEIRELNINRYGHSDMLTSVFARELDDTEAMLESVRQYDRLVAHVFNLKSRLEEQTKLLESLRSGGGNIFTMLQRLSKDEQIVEATEAAHNLKEELDIGEDWCNYARCVLLSKEMTEFIQEKITIFDNVLVQMSNRREHTLRQQATIWKNFMTSCLESLESRGRAVPELTLGNDPIVDISDHGDDYGGDHDEQLIEDM
eukprot:GHVR01178693.1.p1 GENE.GHVR01178693.1~~GHVR01178693.1.p1  ORF type:complete len:450 (+),score=101.58 GHVR01178693.1:71-1420(+)